MSSRMSRSSSAIRILAIRCTLFRCVRYVYVRVSLFGSKDRDTHVKRRACARRAFQPDFAVVHGHVLAHDCQPQARAGRAFDKVLFVVAEEALPDAFLLLFGDADTRIGDADDDRTVVAFGPDGNSTVG